MSALSTGTHQSRACHARARCDRLDDSPRTASNVLVHFAFPFTRSVAIEKVHKGATGSRAFRGRPQICFLRQVRHRRCPTRYYPAPVKPTAPKFDARIAELPTHHHGIKAAPLDAGRAAVYSLGYSDPNQLQPHQPHQGGCHEHRHHQTETRQGFEGVSGQEASHADRRQMGRGQERQDLRGRRPGDARDHRPRPRRRQSRHRPCGEGGAEGV